MIGLVRFPLAIQQKQRSDSTNDGGVAINSSSWRNASMAVEFTKDDIFEGLKNVYDPEIGVNVVDLGLVYDADITQDSGDVLVTMTLTSLGCPLGPVIVQEVNNALKDLPGIGGTDVKIVWSPPWSPDMMSEEAKDELGIW
jgi:metal-sulfur cluster biosynthetic enzyme